MIFKHTRMTKNMPVASVRCQSLIDKVQIFILNKYLKEINDMLTIIWHRKKLIKKIKNFVARCGEKKYTFQLF